MPDTDLLQVNHGIDLRIAAYDEDTDQYVFLDKILTYGQMIHKEYTLPEYKEEKEIRFTLEELQNQELIWDYNESGNWIFGEDTPEALRSLAVNLYQALLDTGHKLPIVNGNRIETLLLFIIHMNNNIRSSGSSFHIVRHRYFQ